MSHNAVKAASFPAAFTAFCHPPLADPFPPSTAVWQTETPKRTIQGAAAASSASQFVSLPVLQPRQPQRPHSRHSTAVSLHMVPFHFGAAPASQPPTTSPIRLPLPVCPTRKLANAPAKPAPQPFGANPPTIATGSGAVPAAAASSPPSLRRRCHCFLPTQSTRNKSRPVQRSGKTRLNTIPSGCRSQSCKPARASLALQPRRPQPPRSRRSATVSLHMVPFHFGAAPCFSAPLPPTQPFPTTGYPTHL